MERDGGKQPGPVSPGIDCTPFICLPGVLTGQTAPQHPIRAKHRPQVWGTNEKIQVCIQTQNSFCLPVTSLPLSKIIDNNKTLQK